jgi:hypothetical protein
MRHTKYLAVLIVFLLSTTLLGLQASATAPRYINAKYDPTAHTLKVTIMHFSPIKKIHYVYRVEVDKNGAVYQAYLYKSQPRIWMFSYTYNVTANPGDVITVSAYCILWGYIQKSFTMTATTETITV